MAGKKGMNRFSAKFKMAVVQTYLKGGKTRRQIAKGMGITNGDSIKGWVRQYRTEKDPFSPKPRGRRKKLPRGKETLKDEVKRLRMENDLLKTSNPNC